MRRRILTWGGLTILALCCALGLWVAWCARDRHPGYTLDLDIRPPAEPGDLRAGFAALAITPTIPDTWTDANGDARYRPRDGDTYTDGNGNGRFDPHWLAGFHAGRPARGVHDDLWARAMVLDDGHTRLGLVVLDAIGFMHDDVIEVRRRIAEHTDIDYTIVCSTHTHNAPDLLGLWGRTNISGGVNPDYLELVRTRAADAVIQAAQAARPTVLRFAQLPEAAQDLVTDGRRPHVFDPGIRLVHAVDAESGDTLGTLFAWANHPETLSSGNVDITSDFPHYVRRGIERGVFDGERLAAAGVGGVAIYVNGAIGGLLSTASDHPIADPFTEELHVTPSFAKAEAQGLRLALLALEVLRSEAVVEVPRAGIRVRAKTMTVPLGNPLWRLGVVFGVFPRGYVTWGHLRTEVALIELGPASFLAVPGEIYPEIVNGGIEAPPGQDFAVGPQEVPPLRDLMRGEFRFILGLANDEIGYMIPKSEWDTDPPYLYDAPQSPYGEITSPGPDTAVHIHTALRELLEEG